MMWWNFVPSTGVLTAYTVACLLLVMTPGPDMTFVLGKAVTRGRVGGFAAYAGTTSGLIVHTSAVAVGLSALLAASPTAFLVLKIAGGLYLLFLAWQALKEGSALSLPEGSGAPERSVQETPGDIFLKGFLINVLNPKVILFFVTFLPQFVERGDAHAGGKLLFLGVYFMVIASPVMVALILSADWIAVRVKGRARVLRAADYGLAAIFAAFAVKLALTQAK